VTFIPDPMPLHHRHRDLLSAVDRLTMLVNAWQPMPASVVAEARRQVGGIDRLLAEMACQCGGPPDAA